MTKSRYNPFAPRIWQLAHNRTIELGPNAVIMGILNVTPDSFSDGGKFTALNEAVGHCARMIEQGADIIDVGGESTRPGAQKVSQSQEQDRVMPVIEAICDRFDITISIDTYRAATANEAIAAGAHLVNDVWGLQFDGRMPDVIAKTHAGACLMHNSRNRKTNPDRLADQMEFLSASLSLCKANNISANQCVIDPGFGFGKNADDNLYLLNNFSKLKALELPLLAGTSRKRFTGALLGDNDTTSNRDIVTSATSVIARMAGCAVFRVHEVGVNKCALQLADALIDRNTKIHE